MDNIDVLDWNEKIRDQEIKKDDDDENESICDNSLSIGRIT